MKSKKKKILIAEAATGGIAWEKVFLEISQNSQETLAQVFSCEFLQNF